MRQLQPSLPTLPSLLGTTGQGGAEQATESRDRQRLETPNLCSQGLWGDSRARKSLLSGVLAWAGQEGAGGPQCVGLGPRALSQPGSPGQLGISFRAMLVAEFTVA